MSRVYWDTMIFIYMLDEQSEHSSRAKRLLDRAYERGDSLFTSYLALGEVMAGADEPFDLDTAKDLQKAWRQMGFSFLSFDGGAALPFSRLRRKDKLKAADAIHVACAASAGIDLFLTGDKQLLKLHVPGIQFIADFYNPLL